MLPHIQNQCFRRSSPSLLLSFFPNIRDCFLRKKKRELATQSSFLCMSTTVFGLNSWSFVIIVDQPLEVSQRASRMTGDTDAAKSFKLFFSFIFFACFRCAGYIPKERRRPWTLQIMVQSMTDERDFWDRWSSEEGNLRLFDHRLKKCLYLYFLALLYFLQALLMAKVVYHCLRKYQRVTPLSLRPKTYPEPDLFFCQPCWVRKLVFFLCVNLLRSHCQIAYEGTLLPQK